MYIWRGLNSRRRTICTGVRRPIDVKGTDDAGLDHALSDEIYEVLGVKKR
jgi:hypothetical protein